jgi:hypothetical protein
MKNASSDVKHERMDLILAEQILGTGPEYNRDHALKCFEAQVWAARENGEEEKIPELIDAKNAICQMLIEDQVNNTGKFNIAPVPFDNPCRSCRGLGERYEFERDPKAITCRQCNGKKEVLIKCPDCKGTTRYERDSCTVECMKCKDNEKPGYVMASCLKCSGSGKEVIHPIIGKIKSTTTCRVCNGLGHILPEEAPFNSVLMKDAVESLLSDDETDETDEINETE